jgi:hypothetical protein
MASATRGWDAELERVSLGDTARAADAIGEAETQIIKKRKIKNDQASFINLQHIRIYWTGL